MEEGKEKYDVKVTIVGNDDYVYEKTIAEGAFSDTIETDGSMGTINCVDGDLTFDPLTSNISSPYINENTNCIITLTDSTNNLDMDQLMSTPEWGGISYYYKGDAINNYIMVNDMLFRIVRINGDGSLRLILNDVVLSSSYGTNEYLGSNLQKVLEEWFDSNFDKQSYLVLDGEFSYLNDVDYNKEDLINMEGYIQAKVGTLSVSEAYLINLDVKSSYLNTVNGFLLMNPAGVDQVWSFKDNSIVGVSKNDVLSVRPVINIKTDNITGSGYKTDPYIVVEED